MEEGIFNTHVIKGVKQVRKETTNRKIGQKKKKMFTMEEYSNDQNYEKFLNIYERNSN